MLKRLFCRHQWSDVNIGNFVQVRVVDEGGSALANYYKAHVICKKCKKFKTVKSGGNSGWSSPTSGSRNELFYKLASMGIRVYEMENGEEVTLTY